VVNDDGYFLVNRVFVEFNEIAEHGGGFAAIVVWVGLGISEQTLVGFERDVVLQHVENKALLDSLTHGVEDEWLVVTTSSVYTKEFERLLLEGRGKGEVADIGQASPRLDLAHNHVFHVLIHIRNDTTIFSSVLPCTITFSFFWVLLAFKELCVIIYF